MRGKHHLGSRMLSIHNVRHYQLLMGRLRAAILQGTYAQAYRELKSAIAAPKDLRGELSPDTVTLKDVG
jgi:queuine tRNA-ribosyltransferase